MKKEEWKGFFPELKELISAWDSAGMRLFLYAVLGFVFVVVAGIVGKMTGTDIIQTLMTGITTAIALGIGNHFVVNKYLAKTNKVDELEKKVLELEIKLRNGNDKK